MFTGLVQQLGELQSVQEGPKARRFRVSAKLSSKERELGASVAFCGVCLTVVAAEEAWIEVDAAFETLAVTTLGAWEPGQVINLEPALCVGDPLGGHLVSGHVDGVGRLRSRAPEGEALRCWFDLPEVLRPLVAPKGSVCVDGVSLTVNEVDAKGFCVGLIPHTLEVTTLGRLEVGQSVNIEVDQLARYLERLLASRGLLAGPPSTPDSKSSP